MSQDNHEQTLNDLLDATLDDLADMPEFKPFPAGVHRVTIKFETKVVNEHPSVELTLTAIESVELSDPSQEPVVAGATTNVVYMLDNDLGQGKLKEAIKPIAAHLGVSKLREVIELSKGLECLVVTKVRGHKTEKDKVYTDVVSISVI